MNRRENVKYFHSRTETQEIDNRSDPNTDVCKSFYLYYVLLMLFYW
jgi:hypothetical protein